MAIRVPAIYLQSCACQAEIDTCSWACRTSPDAHTWPHTTASTNNKLSLFFLTSTTAHSCILSLFFLNSATAHSSIHHNTQPTTNQRLSLHTSFTHSRWYKDYLILLVFSILITTVSLHCTGLISDDLARYVNSVPAMSISSLSSYSTIYYSDASAHSLTYFSTIYWNERCLLLNILCPLSTRQHPRTLSTHNSTK